MKHDAMNTVANYFLITSTIPMVLFVAMYAIRSPWRRLPAGRAIMYLAISMSLILMQNSLFILFGPGYFARSWIRLVLYIVLFVTICKMLYTLVSTQNEGNHK